MPFRVPWPGPSGQHLHHAECNVSVVREALVRPGKTAPPLVLAWAIQCAANADVVSLTRAMQLVVELVAPESGHAGTSSVVRKIVAAIVFTFNGIARLHLALRQPHLPRWARRVLQACPAAVHHGLRHPGSAWEVFIGRMLQDPGLGGSALLGNGGRGPNSDATDLAVCLCVFAFIGIVDVSNGCPLLSLRGWSGGRILFYYHYHYY